MGGQVFFLWARNLVLKIHHVIVKILVLLDHVWRQHFRELVVLETTLRNSSSVRLPSSRFSSILEKMFFAGVGNMGSLTKIGPGHFDVVGHSIEDLSYYCKILVLLDHIWCQHFRELVVLHTTTQEFLFS